MKKLLLDLWFTSVDELLRRRRDLNKIGKAWYDDVTAAFPLGWLRRAPPPYFFWITERSADAIGSALDWLQSLLLVIPTLVAANVVLSQFTIDKKLRQGVMTLDQVALFPIRIIIEDGIRLAGSNKYPREFMLAELGKKFETMFVFAKTGSLKKLGHLLFGTIWGRLIKIGFLFLRWGQMFGYLVLLYNYVKRLEDKDELRFALNAQLSQRASRKRERVSIYRRVGGARP